MTAFVTRYRTPLLIGAGAVVIILAALLAWIVPEGHKLSSLNAKEQSLGVQEQELQAEIVTLQHDQHQQVANCSTLGTLLAAVPASLDEGAFVRDVGALAQASGDPSIPSLTWGASTPGNVASVAVTLTLQGSFGQVMSFVQGLDGSRPQFHRLFAVSSFTIGTPGSGGTGAAGSGSPVLVGTSLEASTAPGYQVTLVGRIFYAPGQQDACAGLKAAAG